MSRSVFRFGGGHADGGAGDKATLGGKGAGLSEMVRLGLPVPPGFVITTEVCRQWMASGEYPADLRAQVDEALAEVARHTGAGFGDPANPLLLSVRSGAPVSMPGMMDTILNLGLNPATVAGLAARSGDPRFAWDCYRRFIAMYGDVVLGVVAPDEHSDSPFERLLDDAKRARGLSRDSDLTAGDLEKLCGQFRQAVTDATGHDFPEDPGEQLWGAIAAVFRSWQNPRADVYRRMNDIPAAMGTAVTVQAMVFGNLGDGSATGVCFTRDPSTGARTLYGEFLINAQGEDVVAGVRTPEPIAEMARLLPDSHAALVAVCDRLEAHYKDMQDLEFTIQDRTLWMLQSRTGKRSGKAMVKIAVDLVGEGLIDEKTAIRRIDPAKLDELLHPTIDAKARPPAIAKGLPASPGAAIGKVVFTAGQAEAAKARGEAVVLVRTETSPEDIHGMKAAVAILTARGGMTSHAAVVARGMGTTCVTGCSALRVDAARGIATIVAKGGGADVSIKRGDTITVDGSTGEVYLGAAQLAPAEMSAELGQLMTWVDACRRLRVRTNADTPEDARAARRFGAEGIGLCRTEHMFFQPDRILAVREMILASDERGRRAALEKILPMQEGDFAAIFREMDGLPVTIRLLDPPLHEFLPHGEQQIAEVAQDLGTSPDKIAAKVTSLSEANPMLGHRGCRLAVTFPEIYETQARAIAQAALTAVGEGVTVLPEIMIPFVIVPAELASLRKRVAAVVDGVLAAAGVSLAYTIGTMIELPRACLVAGDIAGHADFFSFGTNDLTQSTLGLSRDDLASFLPAYLEQELLPKDPFVTLDADGVGQLVELAVQRGRASHPGLKVGVCGEHGGDPASVAYFHRYGLDYVSCSPFRVRIARVAAARAALRSGPTMTEVTDLTPPSRATPPRRPRSNRVAMVPRLGSALAAAALAAVAGGACTASAEDVRPDEHSIFFPTGIAASPDDSVAFVTSANSDLRYDSGTVQVLDLAQVSQVVGAWLGSHTIPGECTPDSDGTGTLECDEAQFLVANAAVRVGNFTTSIGVQDVGGGDLRLIVPVRGDPSVTWIDWNSGERRLHCATAQGFELCDDAHRLTRLHGDENLPTLPSEPYSVYVDSTSQYAAVTHLTGSVTLIDSPIGGSPVLADVVTGLFTPDLVGNRGASGIAGRKAGTDNILYVESRSEDRVQTLTVGRQDGYLPFLLPSQFFFLDGVGNPPGGNGNGGTSNDARGIAFDGTGNRAFMVNRQPPSVQVYDTSIDATGLPRNKMVSTTDICREASSVVVGDGGGGSRAYVGCYSSGELYVIDPRDTSVEHVTTVGRGPYGLALAPTRQLLLVANFLEDSIAVVNLDPTSASLYRVVLRIGVRS